MEGIAAIQMNNGATVMSGHLNERQTNVFRSVSKNFVHSFQCTCVRSIYQTPNRFPAFFQSFLENHLLEKNLYKRTYQLPLLGGTFHLDWYIQTMNTMKNLMEFFRNVVDNGMWIML